MRITFLMPCYCWVPSGGFRVVYEYANQLVARGHRVTVIHPRRLAFPPEERFTLRQRLRRIRRHVFGELLPGCRRDLRDRLAHREICSRSAVLQGAEVPPHSGI